MICLPGRGGTAFSEAADGDLRDEISRSGVSKRLDIASGWATAHQVHGATVVRVSGSGEVGKADALWTVSRGLPLAIFTADCLGVVLHAADAVGVAHAGWRGARDLVVSRLVESMTEDGHPPLRADVGPGIGKCCFEVGTEVADLFPGHVSTTTWGTTSVDLIGAVTDELADLDVCVCDGCTYHQDSWFSYRRDASPKRMATIGWI